MSQYQRGSKAWRDGQDIKSAMQGGLNKLYADRTDDEVKEIIKRKRQSGAAMPGGQYLLLAMDKLKRGIPENEVFGTPKRY